jgi:predicted transcriptional regulator
MTYKTGTIGDFMKWTKKVVTKGGKRAGPRRWFDSDETAAKALGKASPEAMVKLLSQENLALLHLIASRRPASLRELAILAGRKESNLSRTLKKLRDVGIVVFDEGQGRTRTPRVVARRVTLELNLMVPGGSVVVERPDMQRRG